MKTRTKKTTKEYYIQKMEEVAVTRKLVLIRPLYTTIPAGLYEVFIHEDEDSIYWINEFAHNANRFIEPSSLLLELF